MRTSQRWIYNIDKTPHETRFNPKKPRNMTNGKKDIKVDSLFTDEKLGIKRVTIKTKVKRVYSRTLCPKCGLGLVGEYSFKKGTGLCKKCAFSKTNRLSIDYLQNENKRIHR